MRCQHRSTDVAEVVFAAVLAPHRLPDLVRHALMKHEVVASFNRLEAQRANELETTTNQWEMLTGKDNY